MRDGIKKTVSPTPPGPGSTGGGTTPVPRPAVGSTVDIKVATSNNFLIQDSELSIDVMTDLIFEDIGGQEIINIARSSAVNGQDVLYQPIKNVSSLALQYNSQNIIKMQNTSNQYFDNFSINLEDYIPVTKFSDPIDGVDTVYIEQYSGDIIINTINMTSNYQVEVEILKYGSSDDDTIY